MQFHILFILCFYPVILAIFCIMLVRQCFKEYFINPNYKARDYIIHNREKVNLAGKIFTGIVCCFVFIFCIFPMMLDLICMINNEYIYCVIEAEVVLLKIVLGELLDIFTQSLYMILAIQLYSMMTKKQKLQKRKLN